MRSANLALRFLLELCALAALAIWGFHAATNPILRMALALGAPVLFALVWGVFVAPKASVRVPAAVRWLLGVVLLEVAALALATTGHRTLGIVLAGVIVVNAILLNDWRE